MILMARSLTSFCFAEELPLSEFGNQVEQAVGSEGLDKRHIFYPPRPFLCTKRQHELGLQGRSGTSLICQ